LATAVFYLPQFQNELFQEIKSLSPQLISEGLFWLASPLPFEIESKGLTWAQQLWPDCERVNFNSISEAGKYLRSLSKGPWLNASVVNHRRAELIAENLKMRDLIPLRFMDPRGREKSPGFCLLNANEMIVAKNLAVPFPQGQVKFHESEASPSRAYLKLWELFTVYGFHPKKGDSCVDLGSCPGGWSWVLANMGCEVVSIDKAPLDLSLQKNKLITYVKQDAFKLSPKEFSAKFPKVTWLFSDIIGAPEKILELVELWSQSTQIKNFVVTIKFKGETDLRSLDAFLQFKNSRALHLFHNKHEVTWIWQNEKVSL
jgi:23S rRNA (cytidine2498-2'-O)-methyltransferase